MRKRTKQQISRAVDAFPLIKNATDAYAQLQPALKQLHKRGYISRRNWKEKLLPADSAINETLQNLWQVVKEVASSDVLTQLLREDQVAEQFEVSRKTLYRRRKSKELPYIKDRRGTIWYAREDLEKYVERSKVIPLTERPRKI